MLIIFLEIAFTSLFKEVVSLHFIFITFYFILTYIKYNITYARLADKTGKIKAVIALHEKGNCQRIVASHQGSLRLFFYWLR